MLVWAKRARLSGTSPFERQGVSKSEKGALAVDPGIGDNDIVLRGHDQRLDNYYSQVCSGHSGTAAGSPMARRPASCGPLRCCSGAL